MCTYVVTCVCVCVCVCVCFPTGIKERVRVLHTLALPLCWINLTFWEGGGGGGGGEEGLRTVL